MTSTRVYEPGLVAQTLRAELKAERRVIGVYKVCKGLKSAVRHCYQAFLGTFSGEELMYKQYGAALAF